MKLLRCLLFFVVFVLCDGSIQAQSQRSLAELMSQRDEYYFSLDVHDPIDFQTINNLCSIDAIDGNTVVCYANPTQYDNLLSAGYQPFLMTPPSLREEAQMYDPQRGMYDWDTYLTYPQFVSMMEGFPSTAVNGRTCTFLDLGTLSTSNHRRILGVRINNGQPNGKPKFLYTSTMHGDEVTGMILMLRLINELCTSTDSRIVNLVNSLDIFIFPCTNPDGTYYGGNNTVNGARRYNGNNVDLNRHFPDFDDGPHPDGASYYQDEAQWMMDLAQQYLFTMGANYHGGAEVVNYPWDTYQPLHPDDAWWQYVSREYAQLCQAVNSNYMVKLDNASNPSGITNGYAWYTITGSRQDYMNYYGQCREVTIECSTTKTPNASQLPNFWNYNHNAMLTYIEECLNGVHGFVYDAETGEPIEGVTVTVQNHDALGSSVSSHAIGDFHRPIKGGSYTFEFSKSGYCTETVEVTVVDGQRVDITVNLSQGCAVCYEQVTPSSEGSYIMGYLNSSNLVMPTHNNNSSVTATSVASAPTDNGFMVTEGTNLPQVTLTAYGSNGQYYISYNGRYLARSSYGSSLTWGTSTSQYGRWYINSNGIYVTRNNSNYYLYFDTSSNAFKLSTTSQNNIAFYNQCDCPVVQQVSFVQGWNWWSPAVEITLEELETALGTNGISINSYENGAAQYIDGGWTGTLSGIVPGQMYKIQTSASCDFELTGASLSSASVTIEPGFNWLGYLGTNNVALGQAFSGFTPTEGDQIISFENGAAQYVGGGWTGTLQNLQSGQGYVYFSNDTQPKTLFFNPNKHY